MKTKSLLLVASFVFSISQIAHAQCSVFITGDHVINSTLRANYGDCHVETLTWQLNGETVSTASEIQFRKKGYVAAGGNGSGSAANQLSGPGDVYTDAAENVYVLDCYNNRVQKWAPGGSAGVTVAGGHGLGSAANQLFLPQGFFIDKSGNIYIADLFNNRIQKWTPGATSGVTVAGGNGYGSGANQLAAPHDVFVDGAGNVYISDGDNNRIQKWTPGATSGVTVAGGNGYGSDPNQLKSPFSIFVDNKDAIYISDRVNNRIQKWAAGATSGITVAGGSYGEDSTELNDPRGLYVDSLGRIYIADYFNNRIQKWVPGIPYGVTVAGGRDVGSHDGQLFNPSGVYISNAGKLYVADEGNNRVQQYNLYGHMIIRKYIPTVPGKYRVIAHYSNGRVDTSAEIEIPAVAVVTDPITITTNSKTFSVFPNPANDYTIVKFVSHQQQKYTVQVTDMSGRVVLRKEYTAGAGENQLRVELKTLSGGAYVVNLLNAGKIIQTALLSKL